MGFLDKLFGKNDDAKPYCSQEGTPISIDNLLAQLYQTKGRTKIHFAYLNIINQTYNRRGDQVTRALFTKLAIEHVEMFRAIRAPLMKQCYGKLPHVPTFQYLATVYAEDGEYNKAIEVCEKAISFGLSDWTKSGYEGRIERIRKHMQAPK